MTTALWLFLFLFAQQPSTGAVEGQVTLEEGGQPVAGETVGLWPSGRTVRTDGAGRFVFSGVSAGQHSVIVIRNRVKQVVPVVVSDGQRLQNVSVVLKAPPAITGTVFDPFGPRLATAQVQAFRMVYRPNGASVRSIQSAMTNDLGEYRLGGLPGGEYYVSAGYSDRDQKAGGSSFRFSPNVSKADDGYPELYVGGGYIAAQSEKVVLRQSDASGNNIYLREGPRFKVSGRLIRSDGDAGEACGRVALVPQGGFVDTDKDFSASFCGPFVFKGVSPGPYSLIAIGAGIASDVFPAYVANKDVDSLAVLMERTVTISGRVTLDSNGSANRRVVLSRNSRELTQRFEAMTDGIGRFEFPEVGPGLFDTLMELLPEGAFIRSIRQGAVDVLQSSAPLRMNFGNLDIELSSRGAKADGMAVDSLGRPVPGAQIVLIPSTPRNREDRYYARFADAGGNFAVTGIAPGSYTAFAFEDIEPGMYFVFGYDTDLLNRWRPRGQRLDFSEGSESKGLKMMTIAASETAGGFR